MEELGLTVVSTVFCELGFQMQRHGEMLCLAMELVRNSGQRLHIMVNATKERY